MFYIPTHPWIKIMTANTENRVVAYIGYLSEEIMGTGYTIAPDCKGASGGRCNFNEFLEHIWKEWETSTVKDLKKPKVSVLTAGSDFLAPKFRFFIQKMTSKTCTDTKKPITYNVDKDKLFPGCSDYPDAYQKCSAVVQNARTFRDGTLSP